VTSLVDELPGDSEATEQLRAEIALAARTALPVLLVGETGSGKEHAARLIHQLSDRSEHPFVVVNLAAIPSTLGQAELFGFTRGAFTGAERDRTGLFEAADKGTILLDEIGECSSELQSILMSVLETGSVRRLGESESRQLDVRIIAATNRDLAMLVESGRFRPDLLTRISGVRIRIPPLRERKAEIPVIAPHMLKRVSAYMGRPFVLAPRAIKALQAYDFPGNFRELANVLEKAALMTPGTSIGAEALALAPLVRRARRPRITDQLETARHQVASLQREIEALRATSIMAQPIWQGRRFATKHDYCFVLMPFGDMRELQAVYRDHVKPTIERSGLHCERADDIYDVSGVMQSVWEGINRARLIVADLTERNANVFYELGIAHTIGKPVIMLSQSIDFVPFDLRHLRCITYTYTPPGITKLEEALERTLKTVLSGSADLGAI
jgi:hypothetical protein